jgi:addiction module RelE/StbE family toxin
MAHKIIWSPEAVDDLEAISEYISRDSQTIAARVIERLLDAVDRLADFPRLGPRIREWKRSPYRHVVVPPYRVIYRIETEAVFVIAVVHGARDLKKLMSSSGRKKQ